MIAEKDEQFYDDIAADILKINRAFLILGYLDSLKKSQKSEIETLDERIFFAKKNGADAEFLARQKKEKEGEFSETEKIFKSGVKWLRKAMSPFCLLTNEVEFCEKERFFFLKKIWFDGPEYFEIFAAAEKGRPALKNKLKSYIYKIENFDRSKETSDFLQEAEEACDQALLSFDLEKSRGKSVINWQKTIAVRALNQRLRQENETVFYRFFNGKDWVELTTDAWFRLRQAERERIEKNYDVQSYSILAGDDGAAFLTIEGAEVEEIEIEAAREKRLEFYHEFMAAVKGARGGKKKSVTSLWKKKWAEFCQQNPELATEKRRK